jgi:hypothetical protein
LDASPIPGDGGCDWMIRHTQKIGKTEANCEGAGGLQAVPGEDATVGFAHFTKLNIGSGLRLIDEGNCVWGIHGGMKVVGEGCSFPGSSGEGGSWFGSIGVGSGLSLDEAGDGCQAYIHYSITAGSSNEADSAITHDANCNTGLPVPTYVCDSACGTMAIVDLEGPYCDRKPPKTLESIWAGFGLGMTSCGSCDMILYNNHRDYGVDNSCNTFQMGQVGLHTYSSDFALAAGPGAGGPCDLDNTLSTSISLNTGGGSWTVNYIRKITCTKSGGYITSLSCELGSIGGSKSCGGKYWITSTGDPSAGCVSC